MFTTPLNIEVWIEDARVYYKIHSQPSDEELSKFFQTNPVPGYDTLTLDPTNEIYICQAATPELSAFRGKPIIYLFGRARPHEHDEYPGSAYTSRRYAQEIAQSIQKAIKTINEKYFITPETKELESLLQEVYNHA